MGKRGVRFILLMLVIFPLPAFAQTALSGFNAKTYYPSFDESGAASTIGSAALPRWRSAFGMHFHFLTDPLGVAAGLPTEVVTEQMVGDVTYALGFPGKLVLGADIPVVFDQVGIAAGGLGRYESHGVGDIAVYAKWCFLCLVGDEAKRHGFGAALIARTLLPSGTRSDFTGSSMISQDFLLALDKKWHAATLAINGGYRLAPHDIPAVGVSGHDDEYLYSIAARFPLLAQQGTWSTFVAAQGSVLQRAPSNRDHNPLEGIVGFEKSFASGVRGQIGFGERPYAAVGAPRHHIFCGVAFVQPQRTETRIVKPSGGTKLLQFAFDSSVLDGPSIGALDDVVHTLKADGDLKVSLEGRADDVGTEEYNWNLSEGRAMSAKAYLVQHGIDAGQILLQWYGKTRPLVTGADEKARAQNRSVMVNFVR